MGKYWGDSAPSLLSLRKGPCHQGPHISFATVFSKICRTAGTMRGSSVSRVVTYSECD